MGLITYLITASGTPANLTSQLTTGYDANGNRTSSSETSAAITTVRNYTLAANRPSGFTQKIGTAAQTSIAYQYNANGDLTSDGLRSYGYDAGGRLASVTTGSGPSAPTTKYAHNALGQRVFKTEALYAPEDQGLLQSLGSFFTSLWGGQSEAEKLGWAYVYSEDGTLLTEQGMGGPNSTGQTNYIWLPTANGPMPVAVEMNGQLFAVVSDHLNTPRALTRPDGTITWQWAMSAWGQTPATSIATRFKDVPAPQGTPSFNLRFPGQYADQESGLFYNGHRSYDPKTGRYPQPDPIGLAGSFSITGPISPFYKTSVRFDPRSINPGGMNRFMYANGNTLNFSDPTGLFVPLVIPGVCAAGGCELAGAALAAGALWWADHNPFSSRGAMSAPLPMKNSAADRCEADCEKDYDVEMDECRAYAAMTGDKYTFVACKKKAESNLSSCMAKCAKDCK